jgi:hypothetical protein
MYLKIRTKTDITFIISIVILDDLTENRQKPEKYTVVICIYLLIYTNIYVYIHTNSRAKR